MENAVASATPDAPEELQAGEAYLNGSNEPDPQDDSDASSESESRSRHNAMNDRGISDWWANAQADEE